jgi:hypothetical protein
LLPAVPASSFFTIRLKLRLTLTAPIAGSGFALYCALERDELSLNRLLIPFVPAEAGTQFLAEFSAPGFPLSRE